MTAAALETHGLYGPMDLGYFNPNQGTFCVYPRRHDDGGFKLHVTARPDDAEAVARCVLPILRALDTHHKVVRDRTTYLRMHQGSQRGKFITAYPGGAAGAQIVLDRIDARLLALRSEAGVLPGPAPLSRPSRHREVEIGVGRSGFVYTLWSDDYDV
jgi:hypothetical protein